MKTISLGYHDVDDGPVQTADTRPAAALYTLRCQDFRNHLQSIREEKVAISLIKSSLRCGDKAPIFLTFDDGAISAYTCIAGELEQNGWRGHFFVTTDWIGRPGFLDRWQIRELHDRGHVIGSHTCSHPARMSHLSPNALAKEWSQSCTVLSEVLGTNIKVASVPDGYYARAVGAAAARAGIKALFTSEATATTTVVDGCLILGRYFIRRHTPPAVSGALAAGRLWHRWEQAALWRAKKSVKALTGESYAAIRQYLISQKPHRHRANLP